MIHWFVASVLEVRRVTCHGPVSIYLRLYGSRPTGVSAVLELRPQNRVLSSGGEILYRQCKSLIDSRSSGNVRVLVFHIRRLDDPFLIGRSNELILLLRGGGDIGEVLLSDVLERVLEVGLVNRRDLPLYTARISVERSSRCAA